MDGLTKSIKSPSSATKAIFGWRKLDLSRWTIFALYDIILYFSASDPELMLLFLCETLKKTCSSLSNSPLLTTCRQAVQTSAFRILEQALLPLPELKGLQPRHKQWRGPAEEAADGSWRSEGASDGVSAGRGKKKKHTQRGWFCSEENLQQPF